MGCSFGYEYVLTTYAECGRILPRASEKYWLSRFVFYKRARWRTVLGGEWHIEAAGLLDLMLWM